MNFVGRGEHKHLVRNIQLGYLEKGVDQKSEVLPRLRDKKHYA